MTLCLVLDLLHKQTHYFLGLAALCNLSKDAGSHFSVDHKYPEH